METPNFIQLTRDNIDKEHICCAFSDKKCTQGTFYKKRWLKNQIDDGYVFRKLDARAKVFIEYVPAEKAWVPVDAAGYMMINCFWVSGRYQKQGYGTQLYETCLKDAKGMNGIVVVTAKKKQPFMSDRSFFKKKKFILADTAAPYFELWYLAFQKDAPKPQFKDIARNGENDLKEGIVVYYTDACPFNDYYVNSELKHAAAKRKIPLTIKKLNTLEEAQNHFVPHTIYSVFYKGKFKTQHVLKHNYFDKFIP